jgi:hypothetical protein
MGGKVEANDLVEGLPAAMRQVDPATEWVSRNLRNFLRRGKAFGSLPEALASELALDRDGKPEGAGLARLCDALARAVGERHAARPARSMYVCVPHAVDLADLAVRKARNAHARSRKAMLREADIPLTPTIAWKDGPASPITARSAVVSFGEILSIQIRFSPYGDGRWEQGWSLSRSTEDLMRSSGLVCGTGWFPRIDKGIREATRQFLEAVRPESLEIHGSDAKRNRHNAATYGSILPQGYALERIRGPEGGRAEESGVSAVRLVRLPAYAPSVAEPSRTTIADVEARLHPHAVDEEWLRRVIGGFLRSPRPLAPLPDALARVLAVPPDVEPRGKALAAVLAAALHAAGEERRAGRGTARLTLWSALAMADRQAADLPDRSALQAAFSLNPELAVTTWRRGIEIHVDAGPFAVAAVFGAKAPGAWSMGWTLDQKGADLARRLHALRRIDARGAGLFPAADRCVRLAIAEFLRVAEPETLELDGSGPARSAHYANTFGSIAPDSYVVMPNVAQGNVRADARGVVGARFERLREPRAAADPGRVGLGLADVEAAEPPSGPAP